VTTSPGPIIIVGITDRGVESLLPEARALVDAAEVLCGGERHLAFFPGHSAERIVIKSNVDAIVERLRSETRRTVVLASGDPCCYGIGPILAERLGRDRVRIVPNLSAVQLAFARLRLAWQDAAILSAHGRGLDGILPAALLARKAAILTDGVNTPAAVARALLDAGDHDARIDVFEHLDGPSERHVAGCLADVAAQTFDPLNIVVLRHDGTPRLWPLGLPESAFEHRAGLITKAEVRAVTLSKLRLHERAVLWDVGAGCGSIAVEAAALLRQGRVYAVERDADQIQFLGINRLRFAAGNVCVVDGEAPEALADLPNPDAVFIGGSGGRLESILETAAERLQPGGRIVANLVGLQHVEAMDRWAHDQGWTAELTQLSVARSAATAGLTRLEALNPIFVVALERA
jgi:precorrin-6Y C5,15-methyltransferase (decarboxylating)